MLFRSKQQNNNSTDTNNKFEHSPIPAQNQTTNPQDNAPGNNNTFIPEEKHIISFNNHEYPGAITPSQWTAISGETISILLEPSDGYVIEPFQEVGLYKGTDNKWYFTMPECDIEFTVKPQNSSYPKIVIHIAQEKSTVSLLITMNIQELLLPANGLRYQEILLVFC